MAFKDSRPAFFRFRTEVELDGIVLSVRRLSSRPFGKSEVIAAKSRWLKVKEPRQKGDEDD